MSLLLLIHGVTTWSMVGLIWTIPGVQLTLILAGATLLVLLWVATALLQVPTHRALGVSWTPEAGSRLVASNWVRTIGWTLRGILVAGMVVVAL